MQKNYLINKNFTLTCVTSRHLHRINLYSAALFHVTQGHKTLFYGDTQLTATASDLIIIPADLSLDIVNHPSSGFFHSDLLLLRPQLLSAFRRTASPEFISEPQKSLCVPFNPELLFLWNNIIEASRQGLSFHFQEHLITGFLSILHQKGYILPLLRPASDGFSDSVRQIVMLSPAEAWTVEDVACQLGVGGSTLRRRLQQESTGFRQIVEEVRMSHALSMLQSTDIPVGEIALQSGYLSGSRFTARFRKHYGICPKNIRCPSDFKDTYMKINSIDHIVLTTHDIQACTHFYTHILGMQLVAFGDNRIAFLFGKQKINVHLYGNEYEPKAHLPVPGSLDLCFIVSDNIIDIVGMMLSKGVTICEGPVIRTGARGEIISCYIRDPDLNLIELSRYA